MQLPFKPGDKVIELGGGDRPVVRPNVDMRPLPTVDIVANLEEPLPIENEQFDGVFSMYAIEHLNRRRVRGFISEVHRILKPNGVAIIVTANLLEQMKLLLSKQEWEDADIGTIFGDQDYPENTHKNGFSPAYAIKLFSEAGFREVTIYEHPDCKTDMILEARKSGAMIIRRL